MSLWTAVCLWSTCLDVLRLPLKKKRTSWLQKEEYVGFLTPDLCKTPLWHLLKWPICLSAVTSCAIEWALNLADQHLCVGVYVWEQYSHMHPCICEYSVCVCECVCVHAHVGKSTGRYILLCHHLCSSRQQATSYTLTVSIQPHTAALFLFVLLVL